MAVTTKSEIMKKLDNIAKQSLEKIALEVQALWENYIQERFYDLYPNPEDYTRTYQLLNSVVLSKISKIGNKWTIVVFMDENSVKNPYIMESVSAVFAFAADGFHGTNFGRKLGAFPVPGDGIHPNGRGNAGMPIRTEGRFYTELLDDLRSGKFVNMFEEILTKQLGLKVTRK